MSISPGYVAFKLAFQLSPILLTRGLAEGVPGGIIPIVALTEGANFAVNLLTNGPSIDLDKFFANFQVLPGGMLINQQAAMYPFANQSVAANAVITLPKPISVKMTCPARGESGYATKLATMTALQRTLEQHNASGGTYSVCTPAFIYTDMIMGLMRDISGGQSAQVQFEWQLDFLNLIVTTAQARSALNNLMKKIQGGLPLSTTSATSAPGLSVTSRALAPLTQIFPAGSSGTGLIQ